MSIPLLCIALLALLGLVLGLLVSLTRAKSETVIGNSLSAEDPLHKVVRAHGNAMEYIPMLALLMFILAQFPVSQWVIWCMILATFFRYVHAAGMIIPATMAQPNALRFIGALGTYLTGFGLCVALLFVALAQ